MRNKYEILSDNVICMAMKKQSMEATKINGFPLWALIVLLGSVISMIIYACIKYWRHRQNE